MQELIIVDKLIKQFTNDNNQTSAAIIGGGNSAHILVNILTRNDIKTTIITRRPNEWNTDGVTMILDNQAYIGGKFTATNNFKYTQDADLIFLCCPVNVQIQLLSKMKPYVKPSALIGTVFGQARFDKMVKYILGDHQPCFAFIQIPWICRTIKYGQSVDNLGDQNADLAFRQKDQYLLQQLDLKWIDYIHTDKTKHIQRTSFVREWFFPSNIIIHPGICYGRFLTESHNKYFYRDLQHNKIAGAAIEQLDDERIKVINAVNNKYHLNINNISILKQWNDIWHCKGQNMCQCVQNEPSLQNITVPEDIHFKASHRFFRDDIPFGLCYIKHYAHILNIDTPFIDRVIRWAQSVMNIEYLDDDGQLIKKNLPAYYANDFEIE